MELLNKALMFIFLSLLAQNSCIKDYALKPYVYLYQNKAKINRKKLGFTLLENIKLLRKMNDSYLTKSITKYKRLIKNLVFTQELNLRVDKQERSRMIMLKKYWQNAKAVHTIAAGSNYYLNKELTNFKLELDHLHSSGIIKDDLYLLDIGAGYGRMERDLFFKLPYIRYIDVEDFSASYYRILSKIKHRKLRKIYRANIQNIALNKKYDIIYARYVLVNLSDYHLIKFLIKCRNSMTKDGMLIIHENINVFNRNVIQTKVYQKYRSIRFYKLICKLIGLKIYSIQMINDDPFFDDVDLFFARINIIKDK